MSSVGINRFGADSHQQAGKVEIVDGNRDGKWMVNL